MIRAVALALLLASPGPQGTERVFRVVEEIGTLKIVRANRAGVTAWRALRQLEDLEVFRLSLEMPELRQQLEKETVTLAFAKMEAVTAAELIAVAAGLDLVTERQPLADGQEGLGPLVATVVRPPSAATPAGRERLRSWGLRWYRNLLKTEIRQNRETARAEKRIHADLALLNQAQGNLAAAAKDFEWFAQSAPEHPFVPEALLKEAECYLEMGQHEVASTKSSRVMRLYRGHPAGVQAAIVFAKSSLQLAEVELRGGRAAKAASTLDDVALNLELFLWGFRDTDEFPQLLLQLAEVHRRRQRPDLVLERISQLESVVETPMLADAQWNSALFLRGTAEVAKGALVDGEKMLWQFVRENPQDPRLGSAWVALAEAEIGMDDPLEALFAARNALEQPGLLPAERSRAVQIEADALLALGSVEDALDKLERELERQERSPDLSIQLAQALLDAGRPERAKTFLDGLVSEPSEFGDRARILLLLAEARQGRHQRLVERAIGFVGQIRAHWAQARLSELVGDAYTALGMHALAAEAYAGRIR